MFFFGAQAIVGVDVGSRYLKAVHLKETSKGFVLDKYAVTALAPELIVDGTILDSIRVVDGFKELLAELKVKTKNVALSVSGHSSVIIKRINLPEMTEEELTESIKFEAEQYIPFDIEDVNLDFQIIGPAENPGQMEVIIVAVKKEKIGEYVGVVQEAGLTPAIVDVDAFALENIYEINYPLDPEKNVALLNIGASTINLNILKGGISVFTRDSSVGSSVQTEALQKELALSFEDAEAAKHGEIPEGTLQEDVDAVISAASEDIVNEVNRSLDYFRGAFMHEEIHQVLLSGGCALVRGFPQLLSDAIGIEVELMDPFRNIDIPRGVDKDRIREIAPLMAVATGLALRRIGDR